MADKKLPTFSFGGGAPAIGSSAPSLFGQTGTSNSGGGVFGSKTPSTSGAASGGLFGNASAAGGTGGALFGSKTGTGGSGFSFGTAGSFGQPQAPGTGGEENKSLFGGKSDAPLFGGQTTGTSSPSLFGAQTTAATGPSLFAATAGSGASTPSFGAAAGSGTSTPSLGGPPKNTAKDKSSDDKSAPGGAPFSGWTGFGTPAKAPASTSAQAGSTTPSSSLFGGNPSTTPAGPPPSNPGLGASTGTSGIFNIGGRGASGQPASTGASAQPFAGFSLGGNTTATPTGSTPTSSAPGVLSFGKSAATPSAGFSLQPASTTAGASSGYSFMPSTTSAPETSKAGFSFGPAATSASASTPTTSAPTSNLFGAGATSTSNETGAPKGGFSFLPAQGGSSSMAPPASSGTAAPTTVKPLFGGLSATTTPQPTSTTGTAGPTQNTTGQIGSSFQPALSTQGPTPAPGNRLKNKTMDEILTRWASDLIKYTKEFRSHAETVQQWDRHVSDNMQRITTLYVNTIKSEKEMQAVEWHLSKVEEEQDRLERMLTMHENDIDQLMARSGVDDRASEMGGPDQEREKTYKLAERLGERLDEMGKDLGEMIDEINTVTANMGRNGRADEPITEIVKILNSHLSQLQEIDRGSLALQAKVTAAQTKASQVGYANGFGVGSVDQQSAVNDFYRSYQGRRG